MQWATKKNCVTDFIGIFALLQGSGANPHYLRGLPGPQDAGWCQESCSEISSTTGKQIKIKTI